MDRFITIDCIAEVVDDRVNEKCISEVLNKSPHVRDGSTVVSICPDGRDCTFNGNGFQRFLITLDNSTNSRLYPAASFEGDPQPSAPPAEQGPFSKS